MKLSILSLLILLLCSCGTTRVGGNLGLSKAADSELEDAGSQYAIGAEVTSCPDKGGFGPEFGLRYASGDGTIGSYYGGTDVSTSMVELYGGVRHEWKVDQLRPFVSGGLGYQSYSADIENSDSASDDSLGVYLSAGVDYDLTDAAYIGLGLRQTIGHEATRGGYHDTTYDTDAFQVLLRFGFSI